MNPSRRWLYHIFDGDVTSVPSSIIDEPYAPPGFADEGAGYIHASFQPAVADSARRYFPPDVELHVLQVDPQRVRFEIVETPRGPMPHILERIPGAAIVRVLTLDEVAHAPDDDVRPPV